MGSGTQTYAVGADPSPLSGGQSPPPAPIRTGPAVLPPANLAPPPMPPAGTNPQYSDPGISGSVAQNPPMPTQPQDVSHAPDYGGSGNFSMPSSVTSSFVPEALTNPVARQPFQPEIAEDLQDNRNAAQAGYRNASLEMRNQRIQDEENAEKIRRQQAADKQAQQQREAQDIQDLQNKGIKTQKLPNGTVAPVLQDGKPVYNEIKEKDAPVAYLDEKGEYQDGSGSTFTGQPGAAIKVLRDKEGNVTPVDPDRAAKIDSWTEPETDKNGGPNPSAGQPWVVKQNNYRQWDYLKPEDAIASGQPNMQAAGAKALWQDKYTKGNTQLNQLNDQIPQSEEGLREQGLIDEGTKAGALRGTLEDKLADFNTTLKSGPPAPKAGSWTSAPAQPDPKEVQSYNEAKQGAAAIQAHLDLLDQRAQTAQDVASLKKIGPAGYLQQYLQQANNQPAVGDEKKNSLVPQSDSDLTGSSSAQSQSNNAPTAAAGPASSASASSSFYDNTVGAFSKAFAQGDKDLNFDKNAPTKDTQIAQLENLYKNPPPQMSSTWANAPARFLGGLASDYGYVGTTALAGGLAGGIGGGFVAGVGAIPGALGGVGVGARGGMGIAEGKKAKAEALMQSYAQFRKQGLDPQAAYDKSLTTANLSGVLNGAVNSFAPGVTRVPGAAGFVTKVAADAAIFGGANVGTEATTQIAEKRSGEQIDPAQQKQNLWNAAGSGLAVAGGMHLIHGAVDAGTSAYMNHQIAQDVAAKGSNSNFVQKAANQIEAQQAKLTPEKAAAARESILAPLSPANRPVVEAHINTVLDARNQINDMAKKAMANVPPIASPKLANLSDAQLQGELQGTNPGVNHSDDKNPTFGTASPQDVQAEIDRRTKLTQAKQQIAAQIGLIIDKATQRSAETQKMAQQPDGLTLLDGLNRHNASLPVGAPKADLGTAQLASDLSPKTDATALVQPHAISYVPVAHDVQSIPDLKDRAFATAALKLLNGRVIDEGSKTDLLGGEGKNAALPKHIGESGMPLAVKDAKGEPTLTDEGLSKLRQLVPAARGMLEHNGMPLTSQHLAETRGRLPEKNVPRSDKASSAKLKQESVKPDSKIVDKNVPRVPHLAEIDDKVLAQRLSNLKVNGEKLNETIETSKKLGIGAPHELNRQLVLHDREIAAHEQEIAARQAQRNGPPATPTSKPVETSLLTPEEVQRNASANKAVPLKASTGEMDGDTVRYHGADGTVHEGEVTAVLGDRYRVVDTATGQEETVPFTHAIREPKPNEAKTSPTVSAIQPPEGKTAEVSIEPKQGSEPKAEGTAAVASERESTKVKDEPIDYDKYGQPRHNIQPIDLPGIHTDIPTRKSPDSILENQLKGWNSDTFKDISDESLDDEHKSIKNKAAALDKKHKDLPADLQKKFNAIVEERQYRVMAKQLALSEQKNISLQHRQSAQMLSDIWRETKNVFVALGVTGFETSDHKGKSFGLGIRPNDLTKISVDLDALNKNLAFLPKGDREAHLHEVFDEELRHIALERAAGNENGSHSTEKATQTFAKIWNEASDAQKETALRLYDQGSRSITSLDDRPSVKALENASDANKGREYMRMIWQLQARGRTSELTDLLTPETQGLFQRVVDYLKSVLKPIDAMGAKILADAQELLDGHDKKFNGEPKQHGEGMMAGAAPVRDGFYSGLLHVIEKKMPVRAKPEQVLAIAKSEGVKADELKWSGLEHFVQGKQTVTKDEVRDYLNGTGALQLHQSNYGRRALTAQEHGRLAEIEDEIAALNEADPHLKAAREWYAGAIQRRQEIGLDGELRLRDATANLQHHQTRVLSHLQEESEKIMANAGQNGDSKYSKYQLPGGKNYREYVLSLPPKNGPDNWSTERGEDGRYHLVNDTTGEHRGDYGDAMEAGADLVDSHQFSDYTSSHFPDVPNYLAHMRLNDRMDAKGNPGTLIEELQSDRHQAGRDHGYAENNPELERQQKQLQTERDAISEKYHTPFDKRTPEDKVKEEDLLHQIVALGLRMNGVPDAPFRKTWPEFLFRRALNDAVQAGHKWLGWTTGDTQGERFDLSKHLRSVTAEKMGGKYDITATDHNGRQVIGGEPKAAEDLPSIVGKELAKKIVDHPDVKHTFSDLDLKVGGEGMKGFYDEILPQYVAKYVKKWGVKPELSSVDVPHQRQPGFDIVGPDGETHDTFIDRASAEANLHGYPEGSTIRERPTSDQKPIWKMSITDEMRQSVRENGQPLFSAPLHDNFDQRSEEEKPTEPTQVQTTAKSLPKIEIPSREVAQKIYDRLSAIKEPLKPEQRMILEAAREKLGEGKEDKTVGSASIAARATPEAKDLQERALGFKPGSVVSDIKSVGGMLKDAADSIRKILIPQLRSKEAGVAARSIREHNAEIDRQNNIAHAAFEKASNYFNTQTESHNLDVLFAFDEGGKVGNPQEDAIVQKVREMNVGRRDLVRSIPGSHFKNFYVNYLPHLFVPEDRVAAAAFFTKKIEGSRSFLKHRTIPSLREALEYTKPDGTKLRLVSYNPIDLFLTRWNQMDKYFAGQMVLKDLKESGILTPFENETEIPVGHEMVDNRIGLSTKDVPIEGEPGKMRGVNQHYYAPEAVATLIKNHLSPGLRDGPIYKIINGLANLLNQFQLGFSAFHLGFTTNDVAVSKLAIQLEKFADSKNPLELGKAVFTVPAQYLSPLHLFAGYIAARNGHPEFDTHIGSQISRELDLPGSQGTRIAEIANGVIKAGGSNKMDPFYANQMIKSMKTAWLSGNKLGAAYRAPFAAIEYASRPIMEYVVPRQKLAVFADMFEHGMKKLGPDAREDDIRKMAQSAWDSVDNRMGQLRYDNLFWNKTAKDIAMIATRSVGWNLGSYRELLGGLNDWRVQAGRTADALGVGDKGENLPPPEFTHKMAYTLALPMLVGTTGAILNYLYTGQAPQEMRDYFFPKTGEKDGSGHNVRLALPSYMKDVYGFAHQPGQTLANKANPIWSAMIQAWQNKDFYNTEIRHTDGNPFMQAAELLGFVGKQFEPFAVSGAVRLNQQGASPAKQVLPFFGITPAASWIDKSPAELKAEEINQENEPSGAHTAEETAKYQQRSLLMKNLRDNDPKNGGDPVKYAGLVRQAIDSNLVPRAEMHQLIERSRLTPLEREFKGMSYDNAVKVWGLASREEKEKLLPSFREKIQRAKNQGQKVDNRLLKLSN